MTKSSEQIVVSAALLVLTALHISRGGAPEHESSSASATEDDSDRPHATAPAPEAER